jgi:UrcA family protein
MLKSFKITLSAFLVTAALIKAAPSFAEAPAAQNVAIVATADLDLSTAGGRASLDHRLVNAAYEVCGDSFDVDLAGNNAARACRLEVLQKARSQGVQLAARHTPILIAAAR